MLLLKAPAALNPQELNVFYQAIDQWTETAIWILFSIAVIAALTLARKLKPIMNEIERCGRLKTTEIRTLELNTFLSRVEEKYLELASKVDSINADYFCSSEVCSLRIKVLFINVSAAKIQDFVAQSPSLLISLGLLGTFAGLTGGLGEIQTVLKPDISAQEAATGLTEVIAPMSLAFRTSLLGLILSLTLSIIYQLTGWRNLLGTCQSVLTGWLETIVPIRVGERVITPLKSSIDSLNKTSAELPNVIADQTNKAINSAFGDKLNQFFDLYANLASETKRITYSLTNLTNSFQESGSDFLTASEILSTSSFAKDLGDAAYSLEQSKQDLVGASHMLCERFATFREGLQSTQSDIQMLNDLAAVELKKANKLIDITEKQQGEVQALIQSNINRGEEVVSATKELRSTRLSCGKDSKNFQKTAEALQIRLKSDEELTNSCETFLTQLNENLNNWYDTSGKVFTTFEETIQKSSVYLRSLTDEYKEEIGNQSTASKELLVSHKTELERLIDKKQELTKLIGDQYLEMQKITQSLAEQQKSMNNILATNKKNHPNSQGDING